jgi:hypothetical protein
MPNQISNKQKTPIMNDLEKRIAYESTYFYVYRYSKVRYEIRKTGFMYSTVMGSKSNLDAAIAFIKKCEKYPQYFQSIN